MNNLLNIKSFLKFLSRNKGYTAIDVFGLSVSLMFVILIAVYVERELNIDKQQANYNRIVAIGNEEFLESGVPVSYWLEERYPEIEKVCPVITDQGKSKQIFLWRQEVDCRSRICGFDVFRPLFIQDTRWRPRPAFGRSL